MTPFHRLVLLLGPGLVLLATASFHAAPDAARAGERVVIPDAPPDTPDARRLRARDAERSLRNGLVALRLMAADVAAADGGVNKARKVLAVLDQAPASVRALPEFAGRHKDAAGEVVAATLRANFQHDRHDTHERVVADLALAWDAATREAPEK